MADEINGAGLTVKELVLRLEGKIDGYISAHETRHETLIPPSVITTQLKELSEDLHDLTTIVAGHERLMPVLSPLPVIVASHERTIQRLIGALSLVALLGLGTLLLVIARLAGLVP